MENTKYMIFSVRLKQRGTQLAQSMQAGTLDLGVVSPSTTLGMEITLKYNLQKKKERLKQDENMRGKDYILRKATS